jgi:hypothetical protein
MFEDKKQAEEHDKYLELAANITSLIESEIPGIDEQHSEAIGLLLAKRREQLAKACKGKPDELLQPFEEVAEAKNAGTPSLKAVEKDDMVTAIAANQ